MHIADVSYFVKEDSALDRVASQRATSVYLVQRVSHTTHVHVISTCRMGGDSSVCVQVVPMLPRLLCEQLCSLNPNQVIFIYNPLLPETHLTPLPLSPMALSTSLLTIPLSLLDPPLLSSPQSPPLLSSISPLHSLTHSTIAMTIGQASVLCCVETNS